MKLKNLKAVQHPPEAVLRAYADLVNQVFLYLRYHSHSSALDPDELHALGDAMHNVGGIFSDYGAWADDSKYRELYLRPFDAQWGKRVFGLEAFLESRLAGYAH